MAKQQNIRPTSDQPRVSTQALNKGQPNLQYRVQGVKSYTPKNTARVARQSSRG